MDLKTRKVLWVNQDIRVLHENGPAYRCVSLGSIGQLLLFDRLLPAAFVEREDDHGVLVAKRDLPADPLFVFAAEV